MVGWHEKVDGESVRQPGFLDDYGLARPDAEAMIMAARVKAGWITEEDLKADEEVADEEEVETGEAVAAEATAEASDSTSAENPAGA